MRATWFVFAAHLCICATASGQVTVTSDLAYLGPDRSEKLDLYTPANVAPGTTLPGIVLIHGGGWASGDKADAREVDIAKALAARGYAVASINNALGVTANPAWVDDLRDVKTAVQFLRVNASTYHIDANEIGAIGGSAGGHLALMAGLTQDEIDPNGKSIEPQNGLYPGVSTSVQAVASLYGITDLLTWEQPDPTGTPVGNLKTDPNMTALVGVGRSVDPALWQFVSPVNQVRPDSPPVLLLQGTADDVVDRNQAIELQSVMQSAGAREQTYLIKDAVHSFALSSISNLRDIRWLVGDFFDRTLKGAEQTTVVHETFTDNSFTARANPATDLPWIRATGSSSLSLQTDEVLGSGKAIQDAATGDGRILVNFPEVNLDQHGQSLVLSFDMRLPALIPNAADAFRFGLYDSNGTIAARFDDLAAAGHYFGAGDDRGYAAFISSGTANGASLQREVGQAVNGADDLILGQDGLSQLLATAGSLSDGLKHSIQLELERAGQGMFIRLTLDGQELGSVFDKDGLTTFSELVFGTGGALTYRLDNVTTTAHLSLLPGDANRDASVDGADYTAWADHFLQTGQAWSTGDFNGDGIVDGADYVVWADHISPARQSLSAVPEPSALALALIGALALAVTAARRCLA